MENLDMSSLHPFVQAYKEDHFDNLTVFVMMRFAGVLLLEHIFEEIKTELATHNILAVRADTKKYASSLWSNVQTYLHGADAGIAIFDNIQVKGQSPVGINPNVSIEAGYILGLGKPLLLLKDNHLERMPTDFGGVIYMGFDGDNPSTVKRPVKDWAEEVFSAT